MLLKIYYIHAQITGDPCNLIGSHWHDLLINAPFFALKCIDFPANEKAPRKYSNKSDLTNCFRKSIKLQKKRKTTFTTFYKPAQYWINNIHVFVPALKNLYSLSN